MSTHATINVVVVVSVVVVLVGGSDVGRCCCYGGCCCFNECFRVDLLGVSWNVLSCFCLFVCFTDVSVLVCELCFLERPALCMSVCLSV